MRYMFLIYSDESREAVAAPDARWAAAAQRHDVLDEASARGVLRGADPLEPTTTATTIRAGRGDAGIIDGPFADTREQLAGYYIIECRNLDEAIEWARRMPTASQNGDGCVEIRPIHEMQDA
jgi:hypothetical protein